jgi:hypothetical protein
MKIRSSIHAGAQACPEAQHYQQQAYSYMQKVNNCVPTNQAYYPPPATTLPYYPPASTGSGTEVVGSYPDMSGACG